MCGIFGIIGNISERSVSKFIQLTTVNQERGQLGYGLLVANADGSGYVEKGAGEVDIVVKLADIELEKKVNMGQMIALLGHTRAPTGGAPVDKDNNHPFSVSSLLLAHNGIIINEKELRLKHTNIPEQVKTDSIVILYEILSHWETPSISDAVRLACEVIRGSYACWLWETWMKSLYLFRCISPLYVTDIPPEDGSISADTFAFSSMPTEDVASELPQGRIIEYNAVMKALYGRGTFNFYTPYVM